MVMYTPSFEAAQKVHAHAVMQAAAHNILQYNPWKDPCFLSKSLHELPTLRHSQQTENKKHNIIKYRKQMKTASYWECFQWI